MNKKEKRILKALVERPQAELSPADFINGIAQRDERSVRNLMAKGYIETVPHQHPDIRGTYYDIPFYRVTHKGLAVFEPWYQKIWFSLRGDLRTIVVSGITALITSVIAIVIQHMAR